MDLAFGTQVVNMMIALVISLTFHETAHALMAKLQGDRTAEMAGKLTLNPIPHIDPIGTIFFPLLGVLGGGFLFGWAKPTPIDPRNFRNQKWGNILVATAGPIANLLLSIVGIILLRLLGDVQDGSVLIGFYRLAEPLIGINAILAVFNMLPIYPLDGGTVLYELLNHDMRRKYEEYIMPYGTFILLGLMLIPGGFTWLRFIANVWIRIAQALVNLVF